MKYIRTKLSPSFLITLYYITTKGCLTLTSNKIRSRPTNQAANHNPNKTN